MFSGFMHVRANIGCGEEEACVICARCLIGKSGTISSCVILSIVPVRYTLTEAN